MSDELDLGDDESFLSDAEVAALLDEARGQPNVTRVAPGSEKTTATRAEQLVESDAELRFEQMRADWSRVPADQPLLKKRLEQEMRVAVVNEELRKTQTVDPALLEDIRRFVGDERFKEIEADVASQSDKAVAERVSKLQQKLADEKSRDRSDDELDDKAAQARHAATRKEERWIRRLPDSRRLT